MRGRLLTAHYDTLTTDQIARFTNNMKRRVLHTPSGCVEVVGVPVHSGHQQISIGSMAHPPWLRVRAHVFAWEVAHKCRVPAGKVVMHSCDNPRCINPEHLKAGTQGENVYDSIQKGRYNAFGRQKLNAKQVREIRRRAATGERHKDIAKDFGLARHSVCAIANRHSWAHLDSIDAVLERVPHVLLPVRGILHVHGDR